MSQDLLPPRTSPKSDEPLDDLDGRVSISVTDLLERVWRLFISKRTGLFLILGLGLLTLIGTLLVQAPAGVRGDADAYAAWVKSVHPKYGGWTTVFDTLGLFTVFSSILFKTLLALLSTSIVACSINRFPRLWRKATRPPLSRNESFFFRAPLRASVTTSTKPDEAFESVRKTLRSHHYRVLSKPVDETKPDAARTIYADKYRWAPFGTIASHVGLLVIILGAFLTATTGFKDTQFAVPVGSKMEVGHGTGLSVEAKAFNDSYYLDGSPKDYASELVLYKNGKAVEHKTVRVNHPMRFGSVSFYQSFFGVAAAMKVQDASGKTLYQQGVPLQWGSKDGTHSIGQFAVPGQGLTVYVVTAASGQEDPNIKAGQVQLEVYKASQDQPVAVQIAEQGKPVTVAGVQFTFERIRQFTGLIVSRDQGALFVWIGCTFLALGAFIVLFFPHRRVWVRVNRTAKGSEVLCATQRREAARRDTALESQFQQLAKDLQTAVTQSGSNGSRS